MRTLLDNKQLPMKLQVGMDSVNEAVAKLSKELFEPYVVSVPVGLGTKDELKEDYMRLIEKYIDDIHKVQIYCRDMHRGIMNYLRAIPFHAPIKTIVLGQNSYKNEVLPRYASALAYSIHVCAQPPPSVEVMAKALAGTSHTYEHWVCLLRNSYLFLQRSAVFLNVVPYPECGDVEKLMMSTLMSELIIDLCKINVRYGFDKLSLFCLGSLATETVSRTGRSMGSELRSRIYMSISHSMNPAFLSYHDSKYGEEQTFASLSRITEYDALNGGEPLAVGVLPATQSVSYIGHKYPAKHINYIISKQVAKRLAKALWDNQFEAKVDMRNSDESETERTSTSKKSDSRQGQRKHMTEVGASDKVGYAFSVVIKAAELLANHHESIESTSKASAEILKEIKKSGGLTKEEIKSMVERLEYLTDDLIKLTSLCSALHATFTSISPLVQSTSSAMPPIVQMEKRVSEPKVKPRGKKPTEVSHPRSPRKKSAQPKGVSGSESGRLSAINTSTIGQFASPDYHDVEETPVTPSTPHLNSDEDTDEGQNGDSDDDLFSAAGGATSMQFCLTPTAGTTQPRERGKTVEHTDSGAVGDLTGKVSSVPRSRSMSSVSSVTSRGKGKGKPGLRGTQTPML